MTLPEKTNHAGLELKDKESSGKIFCELTMKNLETTQATKTGPPLWLGGMLQRKCDCGQHTVAGGGCSECEKKKSTLQRKASNSEPANEVPPIVHEVLGSPGQPLDATTRAFMEPRFGHDFSHVRVHTDARAAESAQAVNALAYAVGRNVVFGAQQYAPTSSVGRKILAHELTHVVQQQNDAVERPSAETTITRDEAHEREADVQSTLITEGTAMSLSPHQVTSAGKANALQLLEKPDAGSTATGGEATSAPEHKGDSATDTQGNICFRSPWPGGEATWEGISQETLDQHVRLKPEEGTVLFKATANSTDACDAVYFGPAYDRFVLKIPDGCTVTFRNNLRSTSTCCNALLTAYAKYKGKDTRPRPGTAQEFGVPNDWEPSKAPSRQEVSPSEKPEESKGTPIPIKG
jgi:Domain of unknown function (DUF4157)